MATKGSTIDKGGFVENVTNASPEPEEKKVRGQQFSYAEMGGVLAQDVEDRRGFEDGGSTTLDRWQLALEQHGPTELTPEEIRSEEHFQRIKDEPGLRENAPLMQTAAVLYGLPRSTVSAFKGIKDVRDIRRLKKLQKTDLYHGGYGWQSGYLRKGWKGEEVWKPKNLALWTTPSVNFAKSYLLRRQQQLSSRTFEAGGAEPAIWKASAAKINKFEILDKPSKGFKLDVKTEIKRLEDQISSRGGHLGKGYNQAQLDITALKSYLKKPKEAYTWNIGYKGGDQNALRRVLQNNNYEGAVNLADLKIILKGGKKAATSDAQFVFLKRPELNKLSNKEVKKMIDQHYKRFYNVYNEGGLVEDMDRLGLARGGLQKRREARQQELYDKGYSRFMNWFVDSFTPFGMIGNVSNLSTVDADRFPRLHNLGVQAGKLYDTAGGAAKSTLTLRKGNGRYDERGFLKTPDSYETNYDELTSQIQAMSSPKQESRLFGRGRDRREARRTRREEEGGWFKRLMANIEAREGGKRGAGDIAFRKSGSLLETLAERAGPQSDRASSEAEANIREAKAAHRRVHYAEGGPADLDVLLDDLKTTYDSLSPEEESELLRMITSNDTTRI